MAPTPQRKLDANKRWREQNLEKAREADRLYRERNREEINRKIREKRKSGEYVRKKAKVDAKYGRAHRLKRRCALIAAMGGKCAVCGFADWRALQVDHVDGGGNRERLANGFSLFRYYRTILADAAAGGKRYQLLCANCNQIKRYEKQEYRC